MYIFLCKLCIYFVMFQVEWCPIEEDPLPHIGQFTISENRKCIHIHVILKL